jgi:hypothetical protein
MDPNDMEASHRRYLWKLIHGLNTLHGELASLYARPHQDKKTIDLIWAQIDELEMNLLLEGVSYESYSQEARKHARI